jgi:hypothetical protein
MKFGHPDQHDVAIGDDTMRQGVHALRAQAA